MSSANVVLLEAIHDCTTGQEIDVADQRGFTSASIRVHPRRKEVLREKFCSVFGEIRKDDRGSGAADGSERLNQDALAIDPVVAGGGHDHGVLARDLISRERRVETL